MRNRDDLKAKANELYSFAQTIDDDHQRLPYIMRAMEFEIEAITLEQQGARWSERASGA